MAALPKKTGKGLKQTLTRKVGPLPVYGWLIAAVGAYMLYRLYTGATGASSATTPTATDTSGTTGTSTDTSGSSGGGSATGTDSTGSSDLLYQLLGAAQQTNSELAALGQSQMLPSDMSLADTSTSANPPQLTASGATSSPNATSLGTAQSIQAVTGASYVVTPAGSTLVGQDAKGAAVSQPVSHPGSQVTGQGYGGIVSTKTLKNGAKLFTYASGRQIEQAPGKSAYVVKA